MYKNVKFFVDFYYGDDNELFKLLEKNPHAEQKYTDTHSYRNAIELNCPYDQVEARFDDMSDDIDFLESRYGFMLPEIKDGELTYEYGFTSDEISRDNATVVWEKLYALLKNANMIVE